MCLNSHRLPSSYLPKLMVTNVRSLPYKYDEAYLAVTENDVDLFAVTETWLRSQVPDGVTNIPAMYRRIVSLPRQ